MKKTIILFFVLLLAMSSNCVAEDTRYNALQSLFINTSIDTVEADVMSAITENDLCYTVKEYNANPGREIVYKIAFEDKVSWQSHNDMGEYTLIRFNKDTGTPTSAEYFSLDALVKGENHNYIAYLFLEEGPYGLLGYYAHRNDLDLKLDGRDAETYTPFETAGETLADILGD